MRSRPIPLCWRSWLSAVCLALPAYLVADVALAQEAAPGAVLPAMAERVTACTACHGKEGRATADGYYPRIAGKPETYLFNQLQNFRDGRRQYPMMNYLLANLSDDYLHKIAGFFANEHPPYSPPVPPRVDSATLERGRLLVTDGIKERRIPACAACHGAALTGVQPAIPGLLGLPRDYINAQLGAWRNGVRKARQPDCMATIAHALTPEDINAASSWLAAQPVPPSSAPAASLPASLPMACGSMTQSSGAGR
ncbi:MAG: Cytochrome c4 [Herbaspirillum frisingense]|uniref:Cytochrome c4 n=1 Tax=Herbaspirillum frisingense TaxID=92645 RepID=A0A7V8FWG3_9BURK|nr:MAG: Cytochrome c4 [Herbaspirillum frisingense]